MNISEIAMLTILISSLLIGTFTIQADILQDIYGKTTTSETSISFPAITDLATQGEKIEERVLGLSKKAGTLDLTSVYDMAALFADVGVYLFKIPNALLSIIVGLPAIMIGIEIPGWFTTMLAAIVMVVIALKIVAIFLKRESI